MRCGTALMAVDGAVERGRFMELFRDPKIYTTTAPGPPWGPRGAQGGPGGAPGGAQLGPRGAQAPVVYILGPPGPQKYTPPAPGLSLVPPGAPWDPPGAPGVSPGPWGPYLGPPVVYIYRARSGGSGVKRIRL